MTYCNVRPRYTSGSPAMVDRQTAERVAQQEREGYEAALSGIYGAGEIERAQREGVLGIAEVVLREQRQRRQNGFLVFDLITEETYWRPQCRGDGEPIEPDCLYDEDHQPDPTTIRFTVVGDGNLALVARCTLCGRESQSNPIALFWPKI